MRLTFVVKKKKKKKIRNFRLVYQSIILDSGRISVFLPTANTCNRTLLLHLAGPISAGDLFRLRVFRRFPRIPREWIFSAKPTATSPTKIENLIPSAQSSTNASSASALSLLLRDPVRKPTLRCNPPPLL